MTANRIEVAHRTARWDDGPVTVADAMDFWSFAAGAANVIMQLSRPGVGHGVVESTVESGNLMKHPGSGRAPRSPISQWRFVAPTRTGRRSALRSTTCTGRCGRLFESTALPRLRP